MGKRDEKQARVDACLAAETEAWNRRVEALGAFELAAETFDVEGPEVRTAAVAFAQAHRALMSAIREYADAWEAHPR